MLRMLLLLLVPISFAVAGPLLAETVVLEADRDATLIQDPQGALANGTGSGLFVGRTNQDNGGLRRAVLHFDVAAVLPRCARVDAVRLTLQAAAGKDDPVGIAVHRLHADWGEGPSYASGGSGAAAEPGDVTWVHTFYDEERWARPGGLFVRRPSARAEVGGAGAWTWQSTRQLVRDVRLWLAAPHKNFGWILIGDETTRRSTRSFGSRELPFPELRPLLEVDYSLVHRPGWPHGARCDRDRDRGRMRLHPTDPVAGTGHWRHRPAGLDR